MKEDFGTMSAGVRSGVAAGDQRAASVAHTPGPWAVDAGSNYGYEILGNTQVKSKRVVCRIGGPDRSANARLIAAAPDMLAALKECASRCRYDGDLHDIHGNETRRDASWEAMRMAEDAIAKAEGQTRPNDDGTERGRARLSRETT